MFKLRLSLTRANQLLNVLNSLLLLVAVVLLVMIVPGFF